MRRLNTAAGLVSGAAALIMSASIAVAADAPAIAITPPPVASTPVASTPIAPAPIAPAPKPVKANKAQSSKVAAPTPEQIQLRHDQASYRERLQEDLRRKEALAQVQEKLLAAQHARLTDLRNQLVVLAAAPQDDAVADSGAATPGEVKELPPVIKASRSYDIETYRTNVAQQALAATQRDIAALNEFLKHMSSH